MNDKILVNPKTNQEYRDVPPTVAAEYLGVALNYVYEGLKKTTPAYRVSRTERQRQMDLQHTD